MEFKNMNWINNIGRSRYAKANRFRNPDETIYYRCGRKPALFLLSVLLPLIVVLAACSGNYEYGFENAGRGRNGAETGEWQDEDLEQGQDSAINGEHTTYRQIVISIEDSGDILPGGPAVPPPSGRQPLFDGELADAPQAVEENMAADAPQAMEENMSAAGMQAMEENMATAGPQGMEENMAVAGMQAMEENMATAEMQSETVSARSEIGGAKPEKIFVQGINLDDASSKKIGWGVKLNGSNQPEVPREMVEALDRYGAIFMGGSKEKSVYLTFDQGYENGYTSAILDTLKGNGVKCAFFVIGDYLDKNHDLVQRMLDEGHIVANHSDKHTSLPDGNDDKVRKELKDINDRFYETFGHTMTYFRPPMGEYSERVLAICAQEGYTTVMWSLTYEDYDVDNQRGEAYAYGKLMDNLHNGAIILLHAVSKDNAGILDRFIKDAKAKGYSFKTLDEYTQ